MRCDVHYPEKNTASYQPVGDTVGPADIRGRSSTLGTFQVFRAKVKENCPNAWVINYTNPMSMCVNALFAGFRR